jgi:arylsulfatase A-like enzyme
MFRDIKNAGLTTAQIGKQHWQGGGAFKRHFETAAEFYKALGLDYAVHIASPFESRSGSGPYRDFLRQKGLLNKYVQDINERLTNDQFKVRQSIMPPELHNDSFIADKAIEFIKNQPEEQPYCLVVGFSAPHTPLDASGKYATMYDPEEIELPANVPEKLCHNGETIDHSVIKKMRASYFGKITMMDDNVGRIIEQTKKRGRWDNTLVIFTADQGLELGAHGNLSKGWFFEESIKAPLMMRWPKKIPSEQRTKALCQLFDIYPTIVEAIGGNLTEDGHFARSLLTLATGKTDKIRNVVFSEFSSGSEELDYMVRTERYKWFIQKGNEYLFDLQKDPYETENIIDYPQNANLAKSMRHKYCEFMLDTQYNYSEYYVPLFQRKRKEEIKN